MATAILRRSFMGFHLTLGLTLLVLSVRTLAVALASGASQSGLHVAVVAVEAVGAVLFLLPRSVRTGGTLLLAAIGLVIVLHAVAGQFRGDLLVYAAGTWFVMVHGSAWGRATRSLAA